jgi:hypothetical protein
MSVVIGRKLGVKIKTIILFYSRIVLKKISLDGRNIFRDLERISKHYIKYNADLILVLLLLSLL